MKCEFCSTDIPVEECEFARKQVINDKEYFFCCDRCFEEFKSKNEE
jgi:YHS domain-containing protein